MRSAAWGRRVVVVLLLVGAVPGCGDDEATQRKAFVEFLQTRIIDKPGLHVPKPSEDQTKKFGPYAKDYAIITGFNAELDSAVAAPMREALDKGAIRSLADLKTRRADFVAVRDGMAQLRAALDQKLAAADAAHAALKQPEDLKPVYDKAYERCVTIPAKAFAGVFPGMAEALNAIVALSDFLETHKDQVTFNGPFIQTSNPALQAQLKTLLDAVNAKNEAVLKAQEQLRAVETGG